MSITFHSRLPDPVELANEFPATDAHDVQRNRRRIASVIERTDPRLMMIVGPCSAWPSEAVIEYADRLARVQEDVRDKLLLVMRCYIQKPRTTVGWPGPLNMPHPTQPANLHLGIRECTKLMHEAGQRLPLADEMLFTHNGDYFDRFLSYTAVGARSGEDMEHRYVASGLEMPVGIKNTTGGDIGVGVNGVLSAQSPHSFAFRQHHVSTTGNPHAHLILRGGGGRPNYDPQSIALANKKMAEAKVSHPSIVVDASHDNSMNGHGKDPELQVLVVRSIVEGIRMHREEYANVSGVMIESFLKNGKQSDKGPTYDMGGLSITDPCLGWEKTERLIRDTADSLRT